MMTYNCRAFFDRWFERRSFLGETISLKRPDVACLQESMVSGAGLDNYIAKCLRDRVKKTYKVHSNAGIIHSLDNHGVPEKFPAIVALIFRIIIRTEQFLLWLPIISWFVASLPVVLETMREFVGRVTDKLGFKIDLFDWYYVSLAPFFGLSTLIHPRFVDLQYDVIALQPNLDEDHMGSCQRVLIGDARSNRPLFWVVNIHLVHYTTEQGIKQRAAELARVLDWMEEGYQSSGCTKGVLMGDHNTLMRNEPIQEIYEEAGYESAFKSVNGKEPKSTWPSGIKAPFMDLDGVEKNPKG